MCFCRVSYLNAIHDLSKLFILIFIRSVLKSILSVQTYELTTKSVHRMGSLLKLGAL